MKRKKMKKVQNRPKTFDIFQNTVIAALSEDAKNRQKYKMLIFTILYDFRANILV